MAPKSLHEHNAAFVLGMDRNFEVNALIKFKEHNHNTFLLLLWTEWLFRQNKVINQCFI